MPTLSTSSQSPSISSQSQHPCVRRSASPHAPSLRLTERQCNKLLSECGLDMCAGLGLGDIKILYNQLAKAGCITFDGLTLLARQVSNGVVFMGGMTY